MQYVDFNVVDGNLEITLLPEGKEFVLETQSDPEKNIASNDFFYELVEWQTCNGWDYVQPEEIGALTSSLILSEHTERDDQGTLVQIGRVFWFPNYQVESEVETLLEKGKVVFTGVDPAAEQVG
jgi:hypothetical protein